MASNVDFASAVAPDIAVPDERAHHPLPLLPLTSTSALFSILASSHTLPQASGFSTSVPSCTSSRFSHSLHILQPPPTTPLKPIRVHFHPPTPI